MIVAKLMQEHNTLKYNALGALKKGGDVGNARKLLAEAIAKAELLGLNRVIKALTTASNVAQDDVGTAICLINGGHDFVASRGGCGYCGASHSDIRAGLDCIGKVYR